MNEFSQDMIVNFLHSTRLFSQFEPQILKKIAQTLKVITLEGGQVLMRQNDPGHSLYIVLSGRLKVMAFSSFEEKETQLGEIGQGEIVGEISLLINQPRTATVRAIRDTVLLEFSRENFEQFTEQHPDAAMAIARFCVKRLVRKKPDSYGNVTTLVFAPAGKNPLFSQFVAEFSHALEVIGSTLYLNRERFDAMFGQEAAHTPFNSDRNAQIASWLHEQELKYRFVIYEADSTLTQWTLRCLRQADSIMLVGLFNEDPVLNDIEVEIKRLKDQTNLKVELILLHETKSHPVNTLSWLAPRDLDDHHHVQLNRYDDYAKLIRFITGSALGLVLSGGGSRAFAYVGLFRALKELKVKFDIVGGTSAGACIAGAYALGLSYEEMYSLIERGIKNYHPFLNYTFPFVSVMNGKLLHNNLVNFFGDARIEDLWTKFFSVTSNLSTKEIDVSSRGLMRKEIKSSMSVPGLFPPVINEKGNLLVDGGILNNLPVDEMRKRIGKGKILAIGLNPFVPARYEPLPDVISGWKLFIGNLFRSKDHPVRIPTIGEVIIGAMTIAGIKHDTLMQKEADYFINIDTSHYGMLQTKNLKELVNSSYNYCFSKLEDFF